MKFFIPSGDFIIREKMIKFISQELMNLHINFTIY